MTALWIAIAVLVGIIIGAGTLLWLIDSAWTGRNSFLPW